MEFEERDVDGHAAVDIDRTGGSGRPLCAGYDCNRLRQNTLYHLNFVL